MGNLKVNAFVVCACVALGSSVVAFAEERPVCGESAVICEESGRYIGWPTVCRRASGELLAVFSGDRDDHVCPWGKVQLVRSTDDGRTWSAPQTIFDSMIDDRDAGIVGLKDGTLLVNFFSSLAYVEITRRDMKHAKGIKLERHEQYLRHHESIPKALQTALLGYWTMRSTDGGKTWEKPVRQSGTRPHNVIELKDGRLLAVGIVYKSSALADESDPSYAALRPGPDCEVSEDGGKSWRELARLPLGEGVVEAALHEPHVVECPNGRLVAHYRYQVMPKKGWTNAGEILQSESEDGGRTWTSLHKTGIDGYPPHLICLKDGRLLCVYTKRLKEDSGIYATLSADNGQTWGSGILLKDSIGHVPGDLGYPSSVQLPDGSILTVYYHPRQPNALPALMVTHWTPPPPCNIARDML